jgi:pSer/pThr/pTyr-binding forkhead associated (FHA) protein
MPYGRFAHSTQSIHHAYASAIVIDATRRRNYNDTIMNQKGLSRFETVAQEMVEGALGRLFGGRLEPLDVASRLVRALEDSATNGQIALAYHVELNPRDLDLLTADSPHLAEDLADIAQQLGAYAGVAKSERIIVRLVADPEIKRHRVNITALQDGKDVASEKTQTYGVSSQFEASLAKLQEIDAFLIVQGRRHVPLDRPLITMGRRPSNDIVLDLPSVSRQHAQIRWRFGRFVLYDVSSRGRTLVNGHPISEQVLRSGDVIALSDALLVYGEGNDEKLQQQAISDDDTGHTLVYKPDSS